MSTFTRSPGWAAHSLEHSVMTPAITFSPSLYRAEFWLTRQRRIPHCGVSARSGLTYHQLLQLYHEEEYNPPDQQPGPDPDRKGLGLENRLQGSCVGEQ